jgi:hypothetical protein
MRFCRVGWIGQGLYPPCPKPRVASTVTGPVIEAAPSAAEPRVEVTSFAVDPAVEATPSAAEAAVDLNSLTAESIAEVAAPAVERTLPGTGESDAKGPFLGSSPEGPWVVGAGLRGSGCPELELESPDSSPMGSVSSEPTDNQ